MFIAAGSGACHCIIGDDAGKCYTWGRNEVSHELLNPNDSQSVPFNMTDILHLVCKTDIHHLSMQRGQLGHGDLLQRNIPTVVKGLKGSTIIAGTVVLPATTASSDLYGLTTKCIIPADMSA